MRFDRKKKGFTLIFYVVFIIGAFFFIKHGETISSNDANNYDTFANSFDFTKTFRWII